MYDLLDFIKTSFNISSNSKFYIDTLIVDNIQTIIVFFIVLVMIFSTLYPMSYYTIKTILPTYLRPKSIKLFNKFWRVNYDDLTLRTVLIRTFIINFFGVAFLTGLHLQILNRLIGKYVITIFYFLISIIKSLLKIFNYLF